MRKHLFIVGLIITGSLIVLSCNDVCSCKKVSCPAYKNANFDQWFPYQANQTIVFNDTTHSLANDTITITSISATESYEANRGCYNGASGCTSNKYIYSSYLSVNYSSSTEWDNSAGDSNYIFTLHDFSVNAKGINSGGFVNTSYPSGYYTSINLAGKTYQNVQTIFRTDTANTNYDVYQVYVEKGVGVIAWRSQYAKTLFVLK